MCLAVKHYILVPHQGLEPQPTDSKSVVLANYTNGDQRREENSNPNRFRSFALAKQAAPCVVHSPFAEAGGVEPLPVTRPLVFKTSAQPLELQLPG